MLIGTVDQLIEDLHARRERWGVSYYVIFEPYVDAFAPVVARLAGGLGPIEYPQPCAITTFPKWPRPSKCR